MILLINFINKFYVVLAFESLNTVPMKISSQESLGRFLVDMFLGKFCLKLTIF